ncbi:MAG: glycosyltransferase family 4 protein [Deltaproteobacteria bacterium]|jgi:glycosyltransferase involved in cell wall biosynthesis|nr:glycosyltransferase family 4 protein [Deltaproteobacteria bacterium]
MKKRIFLFLSSRPESGGSFQYAAAMLDALAGLDPKKYSVCAGIYSLDWWWRVRAKGLWAIPIPRIFYGTIRNLLAKIPFSSIRTHLIAWWDAMEPWRLLAVLWKADMVIIPDQVYRAFPKNIRQVACIHDLMHRYESAFPEVGNPEELRFRENLYTGIIKHCRAVLVDSPIGKEHVVASYHADPSQIFVLPYLVYNGLKSASPVRPKNLPLGIDGGYLFYPAQFWMHKNHRKILEAAAQLAPDIPIHCVFSGDIHKNGYAAFCDCVARLGLENRAHCIGYVAEGELAWLYQHARCMIMPTFFGPTNIPPLEAMYFGCPVGVSKIYGMPEQLGDAPLYFDPRSSDELASVIKKLWLDEHTRRSCIEKGFAVAARHSEVQFAHGILQVIECAFALDRPAAKTW